MSAHSGIHCTLHTNSPATGFDLPGRRGLAIKPLDANVASHLIRNALGGTEYGIEHSRISQLLQLPAEIVRMFRDDITITVLYFNADYVRQAGPGSGSSSSSTPEASE